MADNDDLNENTSNGAGENGEVVSAAMVNLPKENIAPTMIVDEMRRSYLDYAMSVIVSRALPDVTVMTIISHLKNPHVSSVKLWVNITHTAIAPFMRLWLEWRSRSQCVCL